MTDDGLPGCPPPDPDTRTPNLSVPAKAYQNNKPYHNRAKPPQRIGTARTL